MIVLALMNAFVPAVALAVAVWIGLRVMRVNAATRYWTWWAVLVAVIALPLWPQQEVATLPVSDLRVTAPVEVSPGTDWFLWLGLAWAGFALYRLMRIAGSYVHLRRVQQRCEVGDMARLDALRASVGVARRARLLVSREIASPMAVGFLHPAVIVPAGLSEQLTTAELDHVLLHELAHLARWDDWTNLVARLAGAFAGLHPVAAFALWRIKKDRELACDDWVVAATGEARRYAASLARVFELSRSQKELLATGITGSQLGDRVEQILAQGRRFTKGASVMTLTAMAIALVGMTAIGSQSPALVAFAQVEQPSRPNVPAVATPPPGYVLAQPKQTAPIAPKAPAPQARAVETVRTENFLQVELQRMEQNIRAQADAIRAQEAQLQAQKSELAARQAELQRLRERMVPQQENVQQQLQTIREQLERLQELARQQQR